MTGQNGPGDNGRGVHGRSDRLGNDGSMSRCKSERRSSSDNRRGDDRAGSMADGNAGQTTGIGKGDSQNGSEYSLQRRFVK